MVQSSNDIIPFPSKPRIYKRSEHNISREAMSEQALKVLYRLKQAGYQAHLVGGGVRDLLLGVKPKDFDIATDAKPEQVRELFRNCRLIGRRFRLAHVHFGREIIEVATFRANHETSGDRLIEDGMILRDNVYGGIDDDVWRRDFTVNALYYNIADFSIVDYVGGVEDVKAGRIKFIGDPEERYREDPVRMLRAIRFAAKLDFTIDRATEKPISELTYLLDDIPTARLFEEVNKLFLGGNALKTFEKLRHYGLFDQLFPQVEKSQQEEQESFTEKILTQALKNTDERISIGKPINPAFLYSVMLWQPMQVHFNHFVSNGAHPIEAQRLAADTVISKQIAKVAIPRRFTQMVREIWELQHRLQNRRGKKPYNLLHNKRFRAAYDFLLLRSEVSETLKELTDWWTEFQEADEDRQREMQAGLPADKSKRRRPRKRKRTSS
ncbi:MAG: polynucleotide adenylyltransferase PcnB [Gammaproteobacteria bacterium]